MPIKKIDSPALKKLNDRINGLKAIHPNLVFKNGLSVAGAEKLRDQFISDQNEFNTAAALFYQQRAKLEASAKKLDEYSKNIFLTVRCEYGDDSQAYELVGGIPTHKRAKKTRNEKKLKE
jgi:hypothetical protein